MELTPLAPELSSAAWSGLVVLIYPVYPLGGSASQASVLDTQDLGWK